MATKLSLAASVQSKNGRLYAVIQCPENGKTKAVWRALGLPEGANQTAVKRAYREVVDKFEREYAERCERDGKPTADIPIFDYMSAWLEKRKPSIQVNTYTSYHGIIHGRIKQYFGARKHITVGNLTPKDVEKFYEMLFSTGVVANTVIHYHTALHAAFKQAFKDEMIDVNPFDRIDRPKKNKFHGENYAEEELVSLLKLTADDPIYPAIILAGGMGLRRSEALGVRWSRIDWEQHTVLLDTKIVEYSENGHGVVRPEEEMKNKSSRRTLPIPDPVFEMLENQKAQQELSRKMFKGSYNREFDDYVCTDKLGNLIKPSRVTNRFGTLLKKYGMRDIRYHDLRHTFASILLGKDVPLINVSSFLGHSDISTTANIYAHLDKSAKQSSADIISDIFKEQK